jgi:PST family polysaccharide transporter
MSDSVLARSARGSIYNIAVSAATILLGFTRSVLLMRLLGPEQFGAVSLALFFASLAAPFSVLGIDSALIQKKNPGPASFSTHFVLRLILGLAVLLVALLLSPVLRRAYSSQAVVVNVFLILLLVNLLDATASTSGVVLRRDLRFGALAGLNLASSLAMTFIAPLLAYLGAGVWSLVAEQAIGPIIRWLGTHFLFRPWRPSLHFDWQEARSSLKFGFHLLNSNLLGILLDRFDDFWIGTALGPTALGYYSRAYELAQYPERVLATPITNVYFSAYSALQEDKAALSRAFFRSSSFLVRAGLLLAVLLIVSAREITLILFGTAWLPIVPVFRLMLVYIILNPFYVNLSYLIIGVGRPALLTRVRTFQIFIFILAVIALSAWWGIQGVAVAANLMMLGGTLALVPPSRRYTVYSLRSLCFWPAVAAALAAVCGYFLANFIPYASLWKKLLLESLAVLIIYAAVLYPAERRIIHEHILDPLRAFLQSARIQIFTKTS